MSVRELVQRYQALNADTLDKETAEKLIAVLERPMQEIKRSQFNERLAYCTLGDIVEFTEQGV